MMNPGSRSWAIKYRLPGMLLSGLLLVALLAACNQVVQPEETNIATTPVAEDEDALTEATDPEAEQPDSPATDISTGATEADTAGEVTLSDIDDNPDAYLGQTVSVAGDVTEVVADNVFLLNDPALLGQDNMLVFHDGNTTVTEADSLLVDGTVRRYDLIEIGDDLGIDAIDTLDLPDLGNETVLVAQALREAASPAEADAVSEAVEPENTPLIAEDLEATTEPAAAPEAETTADDQASQEILPAAAVTLSEIDDNPEAYLDETVSVRGDVTEVIADNIFLLNDPSLLGQDNMLVFYDGVTPVDETDTLTVTGSVQRFDLIDIQTDLGITFPDELPVLANENETVLVAQRLDEVGADTTDPAADELPTPEPTEITEVDLPTPETDTLAATAPDLDATTDVVLPTPEIDAATDVDLPTQEPDTTEPQATAAADIIDAETTPDEGDTANATAAATPAPDDAATDSTAAAGAVPATLPDTAAPADNVASTADNPATDATSAAGAVQATLPNTGDASSQNSVPVLLLMLLALAMIVLGIGLAHQARR